MADLFKNLAAAQMATADFNGALASADEALKVQRPVFEKAFPSFRVIGVARLGLRGRQGQIQASERPPRPEAC